MKIRVLLAGGGVAILLIGGGLLLLMGIIEAQLGDETIGERHYREGYRRLDGFYKEDYDRLPGYYGN